LALRRLAARWDISKATGGLLHAALALHRLSQVFARGYGPFRLCEMMPKAHAAIPGTNVLSAVADSCRVVPMQRDA
jgi:hypothetical protein